MASLPKPENRVVPDPSLEHMQFKNCIRHLHPTYLFWLINVIILQPCTVHFKIQVAN